MEVKKDPLHVSDLVTRKCSRKICQKYLETQKKLRSTRNIASQWENKHKTSTLVIPEASEGPAFVPVVQEPALSNELSLWGHVQSEVLIPFPYSSQLTQGSQLWASSITTGCS